MKESYLTEPGGKKHIAWPQKYLEMANHLSSHSGHSLSPSLSSASLHKSQSYSAAPSHHGTTWCLMALKIKQYNTSQVERLSLFPLILNSNSQALLVPSVQPLSSQQWLVGWAPMGAGDFWGPIQAKGMESYRGEILHKVSQTRLLDAFVSLGDWFARL